MLRQEAAPTIAMIFSTAWISPIAASSSSPSANPTAFASPTRQSSSPSSCAAAARMRHAPPRSLPSKVGKMKATSLAPCVRTSCLPAKRAVSRTASASSERPCRTMVRPSPTWGSNKVSAAERYRTAHSAPSLAADPPWRGKGKMRSSRTLRVSKAPSWRRTMASACAAPARSEAPSLESKPPWSPSFGATIGAPKSSSSPGVPRQASTSLWTTCGTRAAPSDLTTCCNAKAAERRTSGCASHTAHCSNRGCSEGMCAAMAGTSVELDRADKFPVTKAARRFVSAARSLSPLCKIGAISANEGASRTCANSQLNKASRAPRVACAGSTKASRRAEEMPRISGVFATSATSPKANFAASRTFWCVSPKASARAGTSFGKTVANCFGAQCAVAPSISIAATRSRHAFAGAAAARTAGKASFMPCADKPSKTTTDAAFAAPRTTSPFSENAFNSAGSSEISYGSKSTPSRAARRSMQTRAPWRSSMEDETSVKAPSSFCTTECCFRAPIPQPLMLAATPCAAPRRAETLRHPPRAAASNLAVMAAARSGCVFFKIRRRGASPSAVATCDASDAVRRFFATTAVAAAGFLASKRCIVFGIGFGRCPGGSMEIDPTPDARGGGARAFGFSAAFATGGGGASGTSSKSASANLSAKSPTRASPSSKCLAATPSKAMMASWRPSEESQCSKSGMESDLRPLTKASPAECMASRTAPTSSPKAWATQASVSTQDSRVAGVKWMSANTALRACPTRARRRSSPARSAAPAFSSSLARRAAAPGSADGAANGSSNVSPFAFFTAVGAAAACSSNRRLRIAITQESSLEIDRARPRHAAARTSIRERGLPSLS
mmetsp:Transcript_19822/g.67054  ORF Transcript_19822/g.67054 Transcript_19822/m.67054 type:complete len:842 (+) Transcript_19822:3503-6028(+)